uniref:CD109 molecule n=1 Tax=Echeneis naucrates TaxID=173247 RepID=A0A665UQP2_ECHNA
SKGSTKLLLLPPVSLVGGTQLFSASKELQFDPKGHTTFIQTDKVNYLPGQVVKIRAVSVQPDGKPHVSPVDLIDPRGNLLRQWLAVDSVLGVVSKEFQLSENPLLGRWTVVSTVSVSLCGPSGRRLSCLHPVSSAFNSSGKNDCWSLTYNSVEKVTLAKHRYKLSFEGYSKILRCDFLTLFVGIVSFISSHLLLNVGGKSDISVNKEKTSFIKSSELVSDALKVKSRGQVVSAGTSSGNLTLAPEASWAPQACVLVYCIRPDGEIVNDVLQLPITQTLRNMVISPLSSQHLKSVQLFISLAVTVPPSLVGILVVDKRILSLLSFDALNVLFIYLININGYHFQCEVFGVFVFLQTCDLLLLTDARDGIYFMEQPDGPHIQLKQEAEPRERWNFPETWIWLDTNIRFSSAYTAEITLTVPDSITTWTASAFVVSQKLGLGVVQTPAELTVFQDFFLSLNLPAFIVRGEELLLEVVLFNYLPQNLEVMVIVAESDAFEFVFPDSEQLSMPSVRRVSVGSQSGTSVLVPIRPLVLGEIPIAVKALSSVTSDLVRRTVVVKAEGLEQSFSTSLLFELPPSGLSRVFNFTFPADVVEGSERVSVTAVGDILGPSISGLDSLIQMPHGCGEQNMINFAPNIYVLQYLNATGQARQETADRAKGFMMEGYERELSYQRLDGSFSAFGDHDSSGSSWLTAFVLRCFLQARPFISIDANVLHRAATWLASQQDADGRFEEPGRVIHTELQGGLDGPVSLTAYVLIYGAQVSAGLVFLETRLALGVHSNYSLSLVTYALSLSGSSSANTALSQLIGRAEITDGVPSWSSPDAGLTSSWQPRSADIEMASYLLLAQHKLGRVADGVGLMRWLSQQRNHRGGFGSTQDTIVALQALSAFAALGGSRDLDLTVKVAGDSTTVASFHIHRGNYLVLQSQQVGPLPLNSGRNKQKCLFSLFSPPQLNVFYNIRNEELARRRRAAGEQPPFHLDIELFDAEMNSAHLHICKDLGLNATGMAIMEVGLLSGFSLAPDAIQTNEVVKKVETPPGKVVLYLDSVGEFCLLIPLMMEHKVAKVQEAAVVLYDYYEPRRRTEKTYKSDWRGDMSTCSFCGADCSVCRADGYFPVGAASHSHFLSGRLPSALLPLVFFIITISAGV